MSLLSVTDLVAGYGQAPIIDGVSLAIDSRDIGVIAGPNGAGKSTCLKSLFGLTQIIGGEIRFDGQVITGLPPDGLVKRGMGFVPQEHNVFPGMTVDENLQMGGYSRDDDLSDTLAHVYELFPPLVAKKRQKAGELSGGQRQMVAIGRALMSQPRLLLLDEPTAGLSPRYMQEVFEQIAAISATGVGILMVEQNARQALAYASVGFVLVNGQLAFTDTGERLLQNPEVARSFLGGAIGHE